MKDYKLITKQIGSVYIVKMLDFALAFLLFTFLTRSITQYEFGLYSIFGITILMLVGILDLGMVQFVMRNLTGIGEKEKIQRFSQIFTFSGAFLILSTLFLVLSGLAILTFLGYNGIFYLWVLVVLTSCFVLLGMLLVGYLFSQKESAKGKFLEFLLNTCWTIPFIMLALRIKASLNSLFLTKLLFTFLVLLSTLFYFKRKGLRFLSKLDFNYLKKALTFGLPLVTLVVAQWVITASDRYLIGFFHSAISVAKYSYIYSLLNFILVFFVATIDLAVSPHATELYNLRRKQESQLMLNSILKYSIMLILPCLTGFILLREEIITMISGTNYISALPLIPFLLFFPLGGSLNVTFQRVLILEHKTKTIAGIFIQGMIINLLLNVLLIPKYDYFGAGIATSLTYLFLTVSFFVRSKKYLTFNSSYLRLPRIFISTLIMGISIAFIHPMNIFTKLTTIVFGALVYTFSLYLTKAYVKEELDLMRSFLPRK